MVRPNHTTISRDYPAEVKALTAALKDALAERDRARSIAVALEQEVAAAERVVTDDDYDVVDGTGTVVGVLNVEEEQF